MNAVVHQLAQCSVDEAMAFDRRYACELRTDHANMEMPLPFIGVAGVLVAFVQHLQLGRMQGRVEAAANFFDHGCRHAGNTLRNGFTLTFA